MEDECIEELGRPISQMKVTELRDELAKRALSKSGNKKELIDRLRADVHRQSSHKSDAINLDQPQGQQIPQQLTGIPQQLVGQLDASNQQQIAQQLNLMYPQQQTQMPTSIPQPYHNMSQQMQQQLIAELQNNYQTNRDNLQQQAQQQQQQLASEAPKPSSQTPMDMRVTQPTIDSGLKQDETQSLDLSSSGSQSKQTDEPRREQADNDDIQTEQPRLQAQDRQPSSELENQPDDSNVQPQEPISAQALDKNEGEKEPQSAQPEQELATQDTDNSLAPIVGQAELDNSNKEMAANDSSTVAKSSEEAQGFQQAPISLKRGISDHKSSGSNREKRRKWSSKQESGQVDGDAQATAMSGGISSHKLQELMEVSPTESRSVKQASTSAEICQTQDSKNETEDLEEGQVLDTSGDSAKVTEPESVDPSDSKTPPRVEPEAKKEQKREPESEPEQEREPSNVLLVQNLVRPFTINSLKEVLSQHGKIVEDKFWTDKVKSKCCVVYDSIEVAKQTKESLNGQQWPLSNPKTLTVTFSSEDELIDYQKSDIAKPAEPTPTLDKTENGGGDQSGSKSMADRLGEKINERERVSDQIKKRLGEKITDDIEAKTSSAHREGDGTQSQELDDLFKKTKSVPHLFWLPLTEDQAQIKAKERTERANRVQEVAKSRRSPPRYRSQARRSPRNRSPQARRSPPSRRRSPPRYRSPIRQRSPVRQRSPISPLQRHRSPLRRRSPIPVHRSPVPIRRSPGPIRRSPGPIRRLPGPIRRSPGLLGRPLGPMRRSPGPIRRSPGPIRRSPGPIRRSPGPIRRSPEINRRSPGPNRRSPVLIRRSPGPTRRSPGQNRRSPVLIRRSPPTMRGASPPRHSPVRRRSPIRRRSPVRDTSPDRSPIGYGSDMRRTQRSDRLR